MDRYNDPDIQVMEHQELWQGDELLVHRILGSKRQMGYMTKQDGYLCIRTRSGKLIMSYLYGADAVLGGWMVPHKLSEKAIRDRNAYWDARGILC